MMLLNIFGNGAIIKNYTMAANFKMVANSHESKMKWSNWSFGYKGIHIASYGANSSFPNMEQ